MTDPADAPLDEIDRAILDQIRSVHALIDPPPADLDERVRFAISLETVDIEVARLVEELLVGSGARGPERTRTMTFDAESMTIMVSVAELPDGLLRLDGWLAPAAALRVELRAPGTTSARQVTADSSGRFVFHGVGRGLAQLLVHREDGPAGATTVVTPSLVL
ncbi:MAG TPA: hypothetical protein VFR67_25760 [Pilimelia sp.]|nr:hypothetical protein [Pilimelia sp.]